MTASPSDTDRIERSVVIDAPRERVWRALSNAETFGRWFGANLDGQTFAPGQRARGRITHAGYEHVYFDVIVERMEPQQLLSFCSLFCKAISVYFCFTVSLIVSDVSMFLNFIVNKE